MKKAICFVLLTALSISFSGCYENKIHDEINSRPANAIKLDLIPSDAKVMTVSYYKYGNNPDVPEKKSYTATKKQLKNFRAELENPSYFVLDENDLLSFSKAAYINTWDIKIDFNKGKSLYIYYEGAISQFTRDQLSLPLPHSYYVSADSMHQIQKILIPDFEKDYFALTQESDYKKVDNVNPEKVREVVFYLPNQRKIYEFGDGFIAFHTVWVGDKEYFLRAVTYDANGNFIWAKNYTDNSIFSYLEFHFIEMSDGGFAVALDGSISWRFDNPDSSESKQVPTVQHGYLLKCDKDGNKVWDEVLEFDGNGQVESLVENQHGEILTVGCCQMNGDQFADADPTYGVTDIVLMKYDKNGKRTKIRTFGGSDFESFTSACYSPKTGLVINGTTQSCDRDITARKEIGTMLYPRDLIAVFDDDLNSKWQFVFEGVQEVYSSELVLAQDNIYLAGSLTKDSGNSNKSEVFQFDFEGKLLKSSIVDFNSCLISASQEGKILIANRSNYMSDSKKMQIYKFDKNLNITDKIEALNGTGHIDSIVQTGDGGFFTTYTEDVKYLPQPLWMSRLSTDMATVLCKYDKNGNLEYRKTYDKNHSVENADIVIPLSSGKVIVDR